MSTSPPADKKKKYGKKITGQYYYYARVSVVVVGGGGGDVRVPPIPRENSPWTIKFSLVFFRFYRGACRLGETVKGEKAPAPTAGPR